METPAAEAQTSHSTSDAETSEQNQGLRQSTTSVEVEEIDEKPFLVGPLSSKQAQASREVRDSYNDFWNNIKFRRGWESPLVDMNQVSPLLDEAAEIVVRIRSYLDEKDPSIKMRMRDGSAREYLWEWQHGDGETSPMDNPEEFVNEMVHWTFRDANGYVEGLTEEELDRYIRICRKYNQERHLTDLERLRNTWKETQNWIEKLMTSPAITEMENNKSGSGASKEDSAALQTLLRHLEGIKSEVQHLVRHPTESSNHPDSENRGEEKEKEKTDTLPLPPTNEEISSIDQPSRVEIPDSSDDEEDSLGEELPSEGQSSEPPTPQVNVDTEKNEKKEEQNVPAIPTEESSDKKPQETDQPHVDHVEIEEIPSDSSETSDSTAKSEASDPSTGAEPKVREPREKPVEKKEPDTSVLKIQVIAEEVDKVKPEIQSLLDTAGKLQEEELFENPEGLKIVQQLQKKCLAYAEGLMKDLLKLDEISATQEIRPMRKAQVSIIQKMIDEVDSVSKRLRGFAGVLEQKEAERMQKESEAKKLEEERIFEEKRKKREEDKKKKEDLKKEKQQQQQESEQKEEEEGEEEDGTIDWSHLKLKPKFEVSENARSYEIASFIPGMESKDIQVGLGKERDTIKIEGLRAPNQSELYQLNASVHRRFRGVEIDPHSARELLLKAGSGRFGKFSETYQLPDDANPDNIQATYERGVLRVIIPKIQRVRRPAAMPSRGYHPRQTQHSNPFMSDRDFWW
eukprot:TRINITY_DN3411_c0_g1_i7.p1 TRINITY_DN3411_c0_g1~~TRINITY_DN3411_c0_g1_i7.p1  ORF type:complete len:740 (+),score=249.18 TRINITY_DN3411_c0_g1_i7:190-2409(+)